MFMVVWLFMNGNWGYLFGTFGLLMGAAATIALTPLHLGRPVGVAVYAVAIVMAVMQFPSAMGLQRFLPVFYLKLLVSHLLP